MHHTEHILREMARVARFGIVSFPNFGYWPHIWSILRGRMPVTGEMPYQWYDTPNIHLCTLKDFQRLAVSLDLRRSEEHTSELQSLMRISYAVFCLKKKTATTIT